MVPFFISFFERSHDQIHIRFRGYVPGDDFSGEEIHYDAEIIPLTGDPDIGKVAGPYKVRSFLLEFLL